MTADKRSVPEWSERIVRLMGDLQLTQAGLAERLGVSPATISRWIQGKHEPTAEGYVAMGNLAGQTGGMYFWERAGVDTANFPEGSLHKAASSLRVSLDEFNLVAGRKVSQRLEGKGSAIAIPLLRVSAYGDRVPPPENVSLSEVEVEDVLLAPLSWCPHPEHIIGMHLTGDSMVPTIGPGSILFVDTMETEREELGGKIVVAAHRDLGFKAARFQRIGGADLLISSNHRYLPLDVSTSSKWKIFGRVLWWVTKDTEQVI